MTEREREAEAEKQSLVQRYAARRGITYQAAEVELQAAARPAKQMDETDMRAALAVAKKYGKSFEEVASAFKGERPFRYTGAPASMDTNNAQAVSNVQLDGQGHRDPATPSRADIQRAIENPGPLVTLNGKNAVVGGRISREQMEEIHRRLKVRRGRGEDVTFADVLREFLGSDD